MKNVILLFSLAILAPANTFAKTVFERIDEFDRAGMNSLSETPNSHFGNGLFGQREWVRKFRIINRDEEPWQETVAQLTQGVLGSSEVLCSTKHWRDIYSAVAELDLRDAGSSESSAALRAIRRNLTRVVRTFNALELYRLKRTNGFGGYAIVDTANEQVLIVAVGPEEAN